MDTNTVLTFLQVVIGALGVLVVILAWVEYGKVRALRNEMADMLRSIDDRQLRAQKAQQRVIASYGIADVDQQISLLLSAIEADPNTFNGYNALGYAYLQKGDHESAYSAFLAATRQHPHAKEGWLDLAHYLRVMKRDDLAKRRIADAVVADPSAADDVAADSRFRGL